MIRLLIKKILSAIGLHFKKRSFEDAVKAAEKLYAKTKQKALVFYSQGEFKVVTKETIRRAKRNGFFKGMDYAEIERRAMYIAGAAHVDHNKLRAI